MIMYAVVVSELYLYAPSFHAVVKQKMQDMIERSPAVPSVKPKAQIKTPYLIAAPDDSAFGVVDEEQLW